MKLEFYEQFVQAKDKGLRTQSKIFLDQFIASFESEGEKENWVRNFLQERNYGHKVRHEIYKDLVFPVLIAGYGHKDAWSILWLAKTANNFYGVDELHSSIGYKSNYQLLRECYDLSPSPEVREELLQSRLRWFSYSQHEWPMGILWDANGASLEQCREILQEVGFARSLDVEGTHADYFADFEGKVEEYQVRLRKRAAP